MGTRSPVGERRDPRAASTLLACAVVVLAAYESVAPASAYNNTTPYRGPYTGYPRPQGHQWIVRKAFEVLTENGETDTAALLADRDLQYLLYGAWYADHTGLAFDWDFEVYRHIGQLDSIHHYRTTGLIESVAGVDVADPGEFAAPRYAAQTYDLAVAFWAGNPVPDLDGLPRLDAGEACISGLPYACDDLGDTYLGGLPFCQRMIEDAQIEHLMQCPQWPWWAAANARAWLPEDEDLKLMQVNDVVLETPTTAALAVFQTDRADASTRRLYVSYRDDDSSKIYWTTLGTSSSYCAPAQELPDTATSVAPAAVAFGNGLYVFWLGTDGRLHYMVMDSAGTWRPQDTDPFWGSCSTTPALAVLGRRMYVFIRNEDGHICYRWLERDRLGLVSWSNQEYCLEDLPTDAPFLTWTPHTDEPPAAVAFDNHLYVFFIDSSDDAIYYARREDDGSWSTVRTDSNSEGAVALAASDNELFVVFSPGGNRIWYFTLDRDGNQS